METITNRLLSIEARLSKLSIERIEGMEQKLEDLTRISTTNTERIAKLEGGEVKIEGEENEDSNSHLVLIETN